MAALTAPRAAKAPKPNQLVNLDGAPEMYFPLDSSPIPRCVESDALDVPQNPEPSSQR